ncbi:hypothetical protein Bca4012_011387 [Brassica carinata]
MVSHKCVEEFSLQFPANARAPRSSRKRRSFKKEEISENDKTCAIDLLATVAENLLSESGSSHMAIDKPVNGVEDRCLVTQKHSVKEEFPVEDEPLKPATLPHVNPYQGSLSPCGVSSVINGKVEIEAEGGFDSCQADLDLKPSIDGGAVVLDGVASLGGSSSRTKVPSMGTGASRGALEDVNLFSRDDDDENFSGYICPRVTKKSPRSVPRIGDRRIRKILASRHWKGGSRHSEAKSWRNYYLHHQRSYPIKKRKYFEHISDSVSDDYRLRSKMHRGSRAISTMKGPVKKLINPLGHVCEELPMCHASDMDTVFIKSEQDLALFDKETAADDAKALVPAAALTELLPPQPPHPLSFYLPLCVLLALALPPRSFNYLPRSSVRMEKNLTFSTEASAKPRGALIVVEGLDRSGKSTQCAKLRSFLESSGHPTELWRFPDRETSVGQMISAYLSNKSQLDDRTIHLLFSANRWEKRSLMEEKLRTGTTLIVDRYSYSGVAFSSAKGLGIEWCKAPEIGLLAPDSVLYLDISPERAAERGGYGDERYERVDFQRKVAGFYQTLRDSSWKIIDAGETMEEVEKKIQQVVLDKVKECALGKSLSLLWSS